jgi:hypothetical protein
MYQLRSRENTHTELGWGRKREKGEEGAEGSLPFVCLPGSSGGGEGFIR